jgi:hypothetical protein
VNIKARQSQLEMLLDIMSTTSRLLAERRQMTGHTQHRVAADDAVELTRLTLSWKGRCRDTGPNHEGQRFPVELKGLDR